MKGQLPNLLGAIVRDYFTDHLPHLRGTSPHTNHSYRDSLVLLLRFLSARRNRPVVELDLTDLDPPGRSRETGSIRDLSNSRGHYVWWRTRFGIKQRRQGGERLDAATLHSLVDKLRRAAAFARNLAQIEFSEKALALWCKEYESLTADAPGLLGAITSRSEAQVRRLSLIYALLDRSDVIKVQHLRAALAAWQYCEDSARYIFGDALGDLVADTILHALRNKQKGMTRTEIRDIFLRNRSEEEISRALAVLVEFKMARYETAETGGRPSERWFAIR